MLEAALVTTLKRDATKIINRVQKKKEPILITSRGLPAAVLIDVKSYDALQSRMAILEGLLRGEMDIREGRTLTHQQVEKKMARWLK